MVWQSDFSFDDVGREGDGIVSYFICPNCEADVEVGVPLLGDTYIPIEHADYVEVVRCKYCAHYDSHMNGTGECPLGAIDVDDDWFCKDGIRREREDERNG
jgi:hypothetical protein